MEVFTGLKPTQINVNPVPLPNFPDADDAEKGCGSDQRIPVTRRA